MTIQEFFVRVCEDHAIEGWSLVIKQGSSEGFCWVKQKIIDVGSKAANARRLLLHEVAHIDTCVNCNNKHAKEWCGRFKELCEQYGENPDEDGAYSFYHHKVL